MENDMTHSNVMAPKRGDVWKEFGPLPRFNRLTIAIRAALRGNNAPIVRKMVERNQSHDMFDALASVKVGQ